MERRQDYKRTLGAQAWRRLAAESKDNDKAVHEFLARMRARIDEVLRGLSAK